ncbi:ABC-three component system protein [Sorangium sp. So ce590]|uniref:ABC-three component system protein n=1 Tax=Sorangium sp. So ce590 TaxID=3133317 RepID=UPI003F604B88
MTTTTFSATDSALGYLYQVRVGLLWSLRRAKAGDGFLVSLETLDDVSFETKGGAPLELLQTKHHLNREASLTNASADLWKSMRVWFEGHASEQIPAGTELHLLTTGTAPKGSAAAYLRVEGRDVGKALALMESTARSSESSSNAPAYRAFLAVTPAERRGILDRVIVLDRAPDVLAIEDDLKKEVFWSAQPKHLDVFLKRLEGWWFRRVVKQLASAGDVTCILSDEIEAEMSDLREQFKQDALPIDEDLLAFELDEYTCASHAGATFVRQLEIVEAGKRRIAASIRDYYRAFEQRSRWLRDDLLHIGDLSRYERRLVDEWELVFEAMKDDVDATAAESAKCKAAREVLKWAERATIAIRPGVTEPFVVRGSLHMLADEPRVGWHPDFRDRLASLFATEGGEAG